MHELSIISNIIDIVNKEYLNERKGTILKIVLKIGEFSGVIPEALEFAFEAMKKDNKELAQAELIMRLIPFIVKCEDCNNEFKPNMEYFLQCPKCKSKNVKIISGKEIFIDYIEINEEE